MHDTGMKLWIEKFWAGVFFKKAIILVWGQFNQPKSF